MVYVLVGDDGGDLWFVGVQSLLPQVTPFQWLLEQTLVGFIVLVLPR